MMTAALTPSMTLSISAALKMNFRRDAARLRGAFNSATDTMPFCILFSLVLVTLMTTNVTIA